MSSYNRLIMYSFELFIKEEVVVFADWQRLVEKILIYDSKPVLEVEFENNTIAFFLYSQRDLSLLATKLEKFILKPIDRNLSHATGSHNKTNIKLASKKNIFDIKETEEIKQQRILQSVIITFQKVLGKQFFSVRMVFSDALSKSYISSYSTFSNPLTHFELDFRGNVKVKKKSMPLYLKIDTVTNLFTKDISSSFLQVFGFPTFSFPVYFSLKRFDFSKHSLVVGQTGVGKSKFIELFVKNVAKQSELEDYAIVIIDPHASLFKQFADLEYSKANIDFLTSACNLFPTFSEPKIATELTILLFKTLLRDQFNAKMERVLKYVLYVLFLTQKMSLPTVKKFLTELEFRKSILSHVSNEYEYLTQFFETEFIELQTKFYESAIMPVLVLVDELSFIPAFSIGSPVNLEDVLQNNFLTCFSLNKIYLGEKATRLIAGLIIQQLFLIAQKGTVKKKIILVIDEVSTVENESLINILSEARKFNLSLFLAQQYLTQISPDLLKGILSNVYNYFVFKMSDEDARIVAKNLDISFSDDILIRQKEKGISEEDLKRNMLVTLNPRECLVRAFADGKFYSCFKAKTLDVRAS